MLLYRFTLGGIASIACWSDKLRESPSLLAAIRSDRSIIEFCFAF
jgi:hypothetical protein